MASCDRVIHDQPADRVVRFAAGGDVRRYCLSCFAGVGGRDHFTLEVVRRL